MSNPAVGLTIPKTPTRPNRASPFGAVEFAVRTEELGYESVWTGEGWGTDSFVELTEIACATSDIRVGTSVVNVYSRTPAVLAMAGASLQRVSSGRFVLGVGVSHPGLVENLHGVEYDRPITRVAEAIKLIKALTDGNEDPVVYEGDIFHVEEFSPQGIEVPVYNAAMGEANLRATGATSDGWIPYNIPLPNLAGSFDRVAAAATEADRDPDDIEVTPWIPAAVSPDGTDADRLISRTLASFIGGYTDDNYRKAVSSRFPDEADAIATAWKAGDEEGAIEQVTPEMLSALSIAGSPAEAKERLASVLDHPVIDVPVLVVPYGAPKPLVERTIQTLSPNQL